MACTGTTCNQGRAECRDGCDKLHQDGSNPHAETKDMIELALDGLFFLLSLSVIIFTILAAAGYFTNY